MPNAFIAKKHEPHFNPNKPDKYYYDVKLVDKVVKIGDGDEDFVIEKREVITKTDIDEVIQAQADDVGLDNLLSKFAVTGDPSILPEAVVDNGQIVDFTQMPQDLIEADNYTKSMKAKFDALPDELKQGRDFASFMTSITQAQFDAYVASLLPKKEEASNQGGAK